MPRVITDGVMDESAMTPEERAQEQIESNLDGDLLESLRSIARATGAFSSNVTRDAAIRTIARALVYVIRLLRRRVDAVD